MGRFALLAVLAAALIAGSALPVRAQEGTGPVPTGDGTPAGGAEEPAPPPPPPVTGEKVEVRLRNGTTLRGVLKGAKIEVERGRIYRPVESRDEPGAGVRVWFYDGLNGWIFTPYDTILDIRFDGALTEEEGLRIAIALEEAKRRAEEEAAARVAAAAAAKEQANPKPAEAGAGTPEGGAASTKGPGTGAEPAAVVSRDDSQVRNRRIAELLKRFPPETWKPSRIDEIKKRAIILDIFPSEEEKSFMDNYDLWLEGYELWQKSTATK